MERVNPFRKISLLFTYTWCREEAGIIGNDGHQGVVTARLVKHPAVKLHKYVRILFESGVEGPVVVV